MLPNYHHLKKPTKKPAVQAASWHQEGVSDRHSSGTDTQQTRMDRQAGVRQQTRQDSRNPDPHSGKYSLYFGWIQSIYIYIQIGISCWRCCFNYTVTMNQYSRYFLSPPCFLATVIYSLHFKIFCICCSPLGISDEQFQQGGGDLHLSRGGF